MNAFPEIDLISLRAADPTSLAVRQDLNQISENLRKSQKNSQNEIWRFATSNQISGKS